MQRYEYKVIAAPKRGEKARGAKTTPDRFALALMQVMNDLGAQGWEYLRADTLPCEERSGFTGKTTTFQNMLVFRRVLDAATEAPTQPVATILSVTAQTPPAGNLSAPVLAAQVAGAAPALGPARAEAGQKDAGKKGVAAE